jgi:peptidoglycan/LPS O-acetylase OafA/YrhL
LRGQGAILNRKFQIAARTSAHLDLIRGISALAVMVGHVRGLFFVDFPNLVNPSRLTQVLYAVTGFGHQAVIVFFVLSGYFIGTSVCESLDGHRWSWPIYLVNRLTRLQLVLLPALILGFVWDQIGMLLPQAASIYYGGLYKYYSPSVALRSTFPVFIGNLFFLQSVVSPVFGSNGPLWSLSYEFWYYILFPALMIAAAAWVGVRIRVLYFGLALVLFWFVGTQISLYFLIWLMGTLIGRMRHLNWPRSPRAMVFASGIAALPFAVALVWVRVHPQASERLSDFTIGLCFAIWIYVLIQISYEDVSRAYAKAAKTLASFSYTLYLTHFPALLLLRGVLDPRGNWQPDLWHLAYALAIALLILGFAYLVAECTEARMGSVRRRLLQLRTPLTKEVVR